MDCAFTYEILFWLASRSSVKVFSRLTDFFVLSPCSPKKVTRLDPDSTYSAQTVGLRADDTKWYVRLAVWPSRRAICVRRAAAYQAIPPRPALCFWLPGPDPETGMFSDPWSNALQCHTGTPPAVTPQWLYVCKPFQDRFHFWNVCFGPYYSWEPRVDGVLLGCSRHSCSIDENYWSLGALRYTRIYKSVKLNEHKP